MFNMKSLDPTVKILLKHLINLNENPSSHNLGLYIKDRRYDVSGDTAAVPSILNCSK